MIPRILFWEATSWANCVSSVFTDLSVWSLASLRRSSRAVSKSPSAPAISLPARSTSAGSVASMRFFTCRWLSTASSLAVSASLTRAADTLTNSSIRWSSRDIANRLMAVDNAITARSRTKVVTSLVLIDKRTFTSRPVKLGRDQRFGRGEDAADVEDHDEIVVAPPDALHEFRAPARAEPGHLVGDHGVEAGDLVDLVGQDGGKDRLAFERELQDHDAAVFGRRRDIHAAAQAQVGPRRDAAAAIHQVGDE